MNAVAMVERCARHRRQERTLAHEDIPPAWGGSVYRPGPEFLPSDRGVTGFVPLPSDEESLA